MQSNPCSSSSMRHSVKKRDKTYNSNRSKKADTVFLFLCRGDGNNRSLKNAIILNVVTEWELNGVPNKPFTIYVNAIQDLECLVCFFNFASNWVTGWRVTVIEIANLVKKIIFY